MRVVSLFDGISCAFVALQRAGIEIESYTACEIDRHAIAISTANHPSIIRRGDVKAFTTAVPCDLLIGGSPCTDLSIAKAHRTGLAGAHSSLFWDFVRIKNLLNPTWFILENVASMSSEDRATITEALGVEPILIDAGLVSAQRRKRLFWTNIPVTLPNDRENYVSHILQPAEEVDARFAVPYTREFLDARKHQQPYRVYPITGKSVTLSANGGGIGAKTGLYDVSGTIRRLTPIECERLQGLPDNYTNHASDTQRYKCLGNAFNVEVVAHILRGIPSPTTSPG